MFALFCLINYSRDECNKKDEINNNVQYKTMINRMDLFTVEYMKVAYTEAGLNTLKPIQFAGSINVYFS